MEPTHFVDITDTIDLKIKALLCHESQVDEEAAKYVRERNASIGEKAGVPFAEGFRVMRFGEPDEFPEEFAEAAEIQVGDLKEQAG